MSATSWITAAPGIRYRKHATRKHGARLDRYLTLRFSVAGKQVEEALGWASEGWTVKLAQEKLAELRRAFLSSPSFSCAFAAVQPSDAQPSASSSCLPATEKRSV